MRIRFSSISVVCLVLSILAGCAAAVAPTPAPTLMSTLNPAPEPAEPLSATAEIIDEKMEIILSGSDYADFAARIDSHPEEYRDIVELGADALGYFFECFESGIEDEAWAAFAAEICRDILGTEDVTINGPAQPAIWYQIYKEHVLRLRRLNAAEQMRIRYPNSSALLTVLGVPEDMPVSPPPNVVLPDFTNYDSTKILHDDEIVLYNGVRPGMTLDDVLAIIGEDCLRVESGFEEYRYADKDGVGYSFSLADDGMSFILTYVSVGEISHPMFRGIQIGDTIESVFDRFPVRDRGLKKWEQQTLYGNVENMKNCAWLQFVAGSFYSMTIITERYTASISFSRAEQKVIYFNISG